jgi:hypothetical protein
MTQAHSFAAPSTSDAGSMVDDLASGARPAPSMAVPPLGSRRSPWIAAFLAAFPGLGSIYNGSYARGVAFFLTVLGLIHMANRGDEIWGFGVAFVWLFNVIDAYREARLIRAGLAHDLAAGRLRPDTSVAEGIGLGAVLFLIGLLSFLDLTLDIDIDWIFELWPVGLMIAGGWFVVAAVLRIRARRQRLDAGVL